MHAKQTGAEGTATARMLCVFGGRKTAHVLYGKKNFLVSKSSLISDNLKESAITRITWRNFCLFYGKVEELNY